MKRSSLLGIVAVLSFPFTAVAEPLPWLTTPSIGFEVLNGADDGCDPIITERDAKALVAAAEGDRLRLPDGTEWLSGVLIRDIHAIGEPYKAGTPREKRCRPTGSRFGLYQHTDGFLIDTEALPILMAFLVENDL
jgi:hypothetical protein